jgi:hypothetical protein
MRFARQAACALALASLCAVCAPPRHMVTDPKWQPLARNAVVFVATDFTPVEYRIIADAALTYAVTLHGQVRWFIQPLPNYTMQLSPPFNVVVKLRPEESESLALTTCGKNGCRIRVRGIEDQWTSGLTREAAFQIAVMHEFGHALGLDHNTQGLMVNPIAARPCLTAKVDAPQIALLGYALFDRDMCASDLKYLITPTRSYDQISVAPSRTAR